MLAIDLFCGVGGMSLGFEQAGFNVLCAIDSEPTSCHQYALNFPDTCVLQDDISAVRGDSLRHRLGILSDCVHVVFGGPPCQGFSVGGKRDVNDQRNLLLLEFARVTVEIAPLYFVAENVAGLLGKKPRHLLDQFIQMLMEGGYKIVDPIQVLDACNFGVPQRRRRAFIIGYRKDLPAPIYPRRQWESGGYVPPPITVWDAIGDLPDIDDYDELLEDDTLYLPLGRPSRYARVLRGEERGDRDLSPPRQTPDAGVTGCTRTSHSAEVRARFALTPPGGREPISRFHRLNPGGLAATLRAGSRKTHGSFTAPRPIHPFHSRCISVREAARLHGFPDWFQFSRSKWHAHSQIGNAVPPPLALAVAESVRSCIESASPKHTLEVRQ